MYIGLRDDPLTGAPLDTFDKLRTWKTATRSATGETEVTCTYNNFGLTEDFFPDKEKRCWCEWQPQRLPHYCAADGGDCLCKGNVFFMKDDGKRDFVTQSDGDWTWNSVNGTAKSLKCSKENFEGVDPQPGVPNACFCDDHQEMYGGGADNNEMLQMIKAWWRSQLEELRLQEEKARAEAEAAAEEEAAA